MVKLDEQSFAIVLADLIEVLSNENLDGLRVPGLA